MGNISAIMAAESLSASGLLIQLMAPIGRITMSCSKRGRQVKMRKSSRENLNLDLLEQRKLGFG